MTIHFSRTLLHRVSLLFFHLAQFTGFHVCNTLKLAYVHILWDAVAGLFAAGAQMKFLGSPLGACDGKSGSETGFSLRT